MCRGGKDHNGPLCPAQGSVGKSLFGNSARRYVHTTDIHRTERANGQVRKNRDLSGVCLLPPKKRSLLHAKNREQEASIRRQPGDVGRSPDFFVPVPGAQREKHFLRAGLSPILRGVWRSFVVREGLHRPTNRNGPSSCRSFRPHVPIYSYFCPHVPIYSYLGNIPHFRPDVFVLPSRFTRIRCQKSLLRVQNSS